MKIAVSIVIIMSLLQLFVACRQIFGDGTQTESVVEPPSEPSEIIIFEPLRLSIWNPSDTMLIKWSASFLSDVDIHLYRKTEFKLVIAEACENTGRFSWIIPEGILLSNHYLIKIMNYNDANVYNFSERFGIQ